MKCLGLMKNSLNLSDTQIGEISEDLQHVEKVLEKYDIDFQEPFSIAFYNHIVSFILRAKTAEFVDPIEEETVSELTEYSINIASEMLGEIFKRYKREVNKSEIYLVSIHIQLALSSK